jgi:pimeloyl-ACP methyl ester carboxylesterase
MFGRNGSYFCFRIISFATNGSFSHLLRAAGVSPPYVLVAESSAALDAHVYADSYPKDVAGLVFVNGVRPDILIQIGVAGKLPRT